MLHEGLKGTFLSTNGLDGWLVTNISIGMAYSSFRSLFVQVGLLGFMRIIAFGYQKYFHYIIYKCYKKRELTKKTHWLLKCRFCKKLILYEWNSGQLDTFFIKVRFSCNQNTGVSWVTLTRCKKKCISNVLITGESNFDEKSVQLPRDSFVKN